MQPTISMNKHTTISTPVSEYDDDEIVNPSNNPHIDGMLSALLSRRTALRGLGASAALMSGVGLAACGGGDDDGGTTPPPPPASSKLNFSAVPKSMADLVAVPEGYEGLARAAIAVGRMRARNSASLA